MNNAWCNVLLKLASRHNHQRASSNVDDPERCGLFLKESPEWEPLAAIDQSAFICMCMCVRLYVCVCVYVCVYVYVYVCVYVDM